MRSEGYTDDRGDMRAAFLAMQQELAAEPREVEPGFDLPDISRDDARALLNRALPMARRHLPSIEVELVISALLGYATGGGKVLRISDDVDGSTGKTGKVDQPQIHFELRDGATPVDPLRYLDKP